MDREIADHAEKEGHADAAAAVRKVIDEILARPEHQWFEAEQAKRAEGAAGATDDNPPEDGAPADANPADANPADDAKSDDAASDAPEGDAEDSASGPNGDRPDDATTDASIGLPRAGDGTAGR